MKNSIVFQSTNNCFKLPENVKHDKGFKPCRLGTAKQIKIFNALNATYTDQVYLRNGKLYRNLLNGLEEEL